MKEALIKEVIKYKLSAARMLLEHMPPKASKQIKEFSRLVLEGVNESCQAPKEKSAENLDSIIIE